MEEISGTKSHKLILNNRRTGSFTGILDVLSFDVGEIFLETELAMLDPKGKDLHVNISIYVLINLAFSIKE